MTRSSILAILLGGALAAGCAPYGWIPAAEPFPESSLRTAMSAQHWDVIANDAALQTAALRDKAALQGRALHVFRDADGSPFSRAFHNLLVSRLVNQGLAVATQPEGAVEVRYETQVVRHPGSAGGLAPAGALLPLSNGVVVARQAAVGEGVAPGGIVWLNAAVPPIDYGYSYPYLYGPTRTELVVTTSLIDGGRFLQRKTDVYYLENAEAWLFEPRHRAQTRTVGVTGQ